MQLQPHFAEAHNNLGVALDDQGKWDEALTCYHKAVEHQPAYAEALDNLGWRCFPVRKPAKRLLIVRRHRISARTMPKRTVTWDSRWRPRETRRSAGLLRTGGIFTTRLRRGRT